MNSGRSGFYQSFFLCQNSTLKSHAAHFQVFVQHPPNGSVDGSLPTDTSLVKEYILDDDDCPLAIERQHNRLKGTLSFHIRRRPHDYQPRKRKKKTKNTHLPDGMSLDKLPYLQEVRATPGKKLLPSFSVCQPNVNILTRQKL